MENRHFGLNAGRLAEIMATERAALRKAAGLPGGHRRPATPFTPRRRSAVAGQQDGAFCVEKAAVILSFTWLVRR